jgi:hypothetical protein
MRKRIRVVKRFAMDELAHINSDIELHKYLISNLNNKVIDLFFDNKNKHLCVIIDKSRPFDVEGFYDVINYSSELPV